VTSRFQVKILLAGKFYPYTVALLHSTLNEADIYDFVLHTVVLFANPKLSQTSRFSIISTPLELVAYRKKNYQFILSPLLNPHIPTTLVEGSSYQLTKEFNLDNSSYVKPLRAR